MTEEAVRPRMASIARRIRSTLCAAVAIGCLTALGGCVPALWAPTEVIPPDQVIFPFGDRAEFYVWGGVKEEGRLLPSVDSRTGEHELVVLSRNDACNCYSVPVTAGRLLELRFFKIGNADIGFSMRIRDHDNDEQEMVFYLVLDQKPEMLEVYSLASGKNFLKKYTASMIRSLNLVMAHKPTSEPAPAGFPATRVSPEDLAYVESFEGMRAIASDILEAARSPVARHDGLDKTDLDGRTVRQHAGLSREPLPKAQIQRVPETLR